MLTIARYHRSEEKSRNYTKGLASSLGVASFGTKLLSGKSFKIETSGGAINVDPRQEVRTARLDGVPTVMQALFDQTDELMPPAFNLGATSTVQGISMKLNIRIGSFSKEVSTPGIIEAPVTALADDILYFRRQVVEMSEKGELPIIARSYRTYLQVCISMIDAFIGQATFALGERSTAISNSEPFNTIRSVAPFHARFEAWCSLCGFDPKFYWQSKNWSDLKALRTERNGYVHPSEPAYSVELEKIIENLNRCSDGIGGTLAEMRTMADMDTKASYIQRVLTAPKVSLAN